MEPTVPRRNGALAKRISASNFYSSCNLRVATKLWDRFLIFCAVAGRGRFFPKRGTPPISGTGWDVKPKFSRYVETFLMQLRVEGILLPYFQWPLLVPRTIEFLTEVKRGGHFLDLQRKLWNMTDILGCGKEFARPYAIQSRRRSEVSAARGQNAKGHFSKIALKKKFNNSPVRGGKNQGAEIFFSFRGLTCPRSLRKWASYDVSPIFGIFSKSGPKRVRYTAFSSRSAFFSSRLAFHDLYFFKISI